MNPEEVLQANLKSSNLTFFINDTLDIIKSKMSSLFEKILQEFHSIELKGSGFTLNKIDALIVAFNKYNSLKISKHIDLSS